MERKSAQSGKWTQAHPVDVRDTEVTLTGLQPGLTYQFRVKAYNAIGWSHPSKESEPYQILIDPDSAVHPSFMEGLRDITVMEHEKVNTCTIQVQNPPSYHDMTPCIKQLIIKILSCEIFF